MLAWQTLLLLVAAGLVMGVSSKKNFASTT